MALDPVRSSCYDGPLSQGVLVDIAKTSPLPEGAPVQVWNSRGYMQSTVVRRKDPPSKPESEMTRYVLKGPSGNEYVRKRQSIETPPASGG